MKLVLALIGALFAAIAAQAGDLHGQMLAQARYSGVGWQADGSHWSIEVLITEKGAQVAYPSAACSGQWTLINRMPERLDFMEQITDGIEECIPLGAVTLEPMADGRLMYTFREHQAAVLARAVLVPLGVERLDYMQRLRLTLDNIDFDYLLPEYFE